MINAGKLTVQITVQTKTVTQDSELNATESWADTVTVWAEPLEQTSREVYRLRTENPAVSRAFRIRYRTGITAYQRIKFGTEYYSIIGKPINENERGESLLIACEGMV